MSNMIWNLDTAHSDVNFKVKHLMITNLKGSFKQFSSRVETEGTDFSTAKISFTIQVNSIDSNNPQRNGHLLSDDFFNAEKFPEIRFESDSLKQVKTDEWLLAGRLTIRDKTNPVQLKVTSGGLISSPDGKYRAGFELSGTVSRKAFDLRWNMLTETGGAIVSDDVRVECAMEYVSA